MRQLIAIILLLATSFSATAQEVPKLTSFRMASGQKHTGEVIHQAEDFTILYDIALRDTVRIGKEQVKATTENIDERQAKYHTSFAVYATWKLIKLMKSGTIQGNIASASDQGLYINLGSSEAIEVGQQVKLLGAGEVITDPETEEVLAVVRPTVATMKVVQVVNEKLSKVELEVPDAEVTLERGMLVEIERPAKTVILIPPKWKSEDPKLKTGDEVLYLTEHVLTELVRSGVHVISRDQVERVREDLGKMAGIAGEDVAAIKIAEELNAGIMLSGDLLAKGRFGDVFLHATDVKTAGLLGILNGRITRDKIKDEALEARKLQLRIQKKIESLPPLAIEMIRRTNILTQLIEGGCQVVIQVPNGAKVTYEDKKLPGPEVGFPPIFNFDHVTFYDGNAHLAALLAGLRLRRISYNLTDSKPEYFQVLNNRVRIWSELDIRVPIEDTHLNLSQPELTRLYLGEKSRLTGKWCVSQYLPRLSNLCVGGGIKIDEVPHITDRLPVSVHYLRFYLHHLTPGWVNFVPSSVKRLGFDTWEFPQTEQNRELFHKGLMELRNAPLFARTLNVLKFDTFAKEQDQAFNDKLIESLFLSPNHHPTALEIISLRHLIISPNIKARLRARFPKAEIRTE